MPALKFLSECNSNEKKKKGKESKQKKMKSFGIQGCRFVDCLDMILKENFPANFNLNT